MGPRLFSRGNPIMSMAPLPRNEILLQWGHDFSAVEMHINFSGPDCRDGLQWGHDFSAVEIIGRQAQL